MSEESSNNKQRSVPTTPEAEGTPATRTQPGHDFTLQAVMEMQKTLGSVEKSIHSLSAKVDSQGTSIDRIKYTLAFAAGAIAIGGLIAGYIFDKRFDSIMSFLAQQ